jgi:hypothetical protein
MDVVGTSGAGAGQELGFVAAHTAIANDDAGVGVGYGDQIRRPNQSDLADDLTSDEKHDRAVLADRGAGTVDSR